MSHRMVCLLERDGAARIARAFERGGASRALLECLLNARARGRADRREPVYAQRLVVFALPGARGAAMYLEGFHIPYVTYTAPPRRSTAARERARSGRSRGRSDRRE